ncbi:protein IWS1 homolog isoform X1 [Hydra vulgaris]|uniref:protein IWS1 homolog isoform X1 n=1 Tax=Hydra vulgaris TaxID=6087 RepID=UPI001F5F18C0|nr:protein IWS1 homolog [Hydra vulgaris]
MAALDDDDDNLNFSDIDSDENISLPNEPIQSSHSFIAHKEIKSCLSEEQNSNNSNDSDEYEPISPPNDNESFNIDEKEDGIEDEKEDEFEKNQTFEPISPISDPGDRDFEDLGFTEKTDNAFENISDEENNQNEDETEDGKFSPSQESDNELNFEEENSNSSGYHLLSSNKTTAINSLVNKNTDDIEAPVPSPLSDVEGDTQEEEHVQEDTLIDEFLVTKSNNDNFSPIDSEIEIKQKDSSDETKNSNMDENDDDKSSSSMAEYKLEKPSTVEPSTETSLDNAEVEEEEDSEEDLKKKDEEEVEREDAGNLIADIFGESDDEEEFEGFDDDEILPEKEKAKKQDEIKKSGDGDASSEDEEPPVRNFVSDFDLMLQKKKEMNKMKRRSKKDFEVINDNDDIIDSMIKKMKEAAETDRMLNQSSKAATNKMKMLPIVLDHLRKADLQQSLIDCGVLPAMKEWLSPLPDHALPHINIRKTFLKVLSEFPPLDKGALKSSGIGRAVMLLFKHPKEIPENKKLAGKIITNWARPIFNMTTNFSEMSREEREMRDKASFSSAKRQRLSSDSEKIDEDDESRPRKPGDKGWIGRARVPMPSHRDYLNRPASKVEGPFEKSKGTKKSLSRFEIHARKYKEKRNSQSGLLKAVSISLNGGKLAL